MGILIHLNLLGNKKELNVKILSDDYSTNIDDRTSNVLADLNVTIDKQKNGKDTDIVKESCDRSNLLQDLHADAIKQSNSCRNEDNDGEVTLEEYFVVEKVVGNRYNPITKQSEFLLKLKDCVPVNNEWTSVDTKKSQLLKDEEGCLYVQKSQNLLSLRERAFRQHESTNYEAAPILEENNRRPILVDLGVEDLPRNSDSLCTENDINIPEKNTNYPHIGSIPSTSTTESKYKAFFDDMDNISIKCEPPIDIEQHEEYDADGYKPVDMMDFEGDPLVSGSLDNSCSAYAENVKPVVDKEKSSLSDLTCQFCSRTFSAIHYLNMHTRIHRKATIYTCSICNHAFSSRYILSSHERNEHSISRHRRRRISTKKKRQPQEASPVPVTYQKPFKCSLCTRSFANKQLLQQHEPIHSDGHLFPCGRCDRVFTFRSAMRNHEKVHSYVKSLPCSFCGKLFAMAVRLRLHERKHRNKILPSADLEKNHKSPTFKKAAPPSGKKISEWKAIMCPECPKVFRYKSNLFVHMRRHTGEKPYHCALCDYRSSQKGSLSYHMKKHANK